MLIFGGTVTTVRLGTGTDCRNQPAVPRSRGFLTDDGHTVYRATLTGLGERMHLNSTDVDLQTHINDVVNLILFEDLHDVVLTGHSYGGMVITGVIDRIPERRSSNSR